MFWEILLRVAGSVLATVVTGLISWLGTLIGSKIKDARIAAYAKEAVRAAEQTYPNLGTKTGPEKFELATQLMLNKFPKLNNVYVKSLIEGAVFALNNQLEEKKAKQEEIKPEVIEETKQQIETKKEEEQKQATLVVGF